MYIYIYIYIYIYLYLTKNCEHTDMYVFLPKPQGVHINIYTNLRA